MVCTIEGKQFKSKSAAAEFLVSHGKSIKDAAKALGIAYQTVYVSTAGKHKRMIQNAKYHAMRLMNKMRRYTMLEVASISGLPIDDIKKIWHPQPRTAK